MSQLHNRKTHGLIALMGAGTLAAALFASTITADAATNTTAFATKYSHNAQVEAQLLQQAQAEGNTGNANVAAFSSLVQTIDAQVGPLYTSEQSLAASAATVPTSNNTDKVAKLQAQKQKLQNDINSANAKIKADVQAKHGFAAMKLRLQVKIWQLQDRQITGEIHAAMKNSGKKPKHPFNNGLGELQKTILDLQQSAIRYTHAWIAAAKPPKSTTSTLSISGLTYAVGSITIPATGSAASTDSVTVMPTVKDAQGATVATSGAFALVGPSGFSGVSINTTTGQLTVNPGATPGAYTVLYVQGHASESVTITVTQ